MSNVNTVNAWIGRMNAIAAPHYTRAGHFSPEPGTPDARRWLIRAADSARWAMEPNRPLTSRICDIGLAHQAMGRSYSNETDEETIDAEERETVANAIAFAMSLVCERAHLASEALARSEKRRAAKGGV
jgi:hypothetical protein